MIYVGKSINLIDLPDFPTDWHRTFEPFSGRTRNRRTCRSVSKSQPTPYQGCALAVMVTPAPPWLMAWGHQLVPLLINQLISVDCGDSLPSDLFRMWSFFTLRGCFRYCEAAFKELKSKTSIIWSPFWVLQNLRKIMATYGHLWPPCRWFPEF